MSINDLVEEQRQLALQILLEKEVLTTCDFHDDEIYEGVEDIDDAYKYANYLFSKGEASFPFDDRRDMTDTVLAVYVEYGGCDICPSCARHMND